MPRWRSLTYAAFKPSSVCTLDQGFPGIDVETTTWISIVIAPIVTSTCDV